MLFIGVKTLLSAFTHKQSTITGISTPLALHELLKEVPAPKSENNKILFIFRDEDEMDTFSDNFPFPYLALRSFSDSPYTGLEPSPSIASDRLRFLFHAQKKDSPFRFYFSYPEALCIKTLGPKKLLSLSKKIEFADSFFSNPSIELERLGYFPSQFVERPGQYALKGGIVDIFSPAHTSPYRLELFGDEIESIRSFSPDTQRNETEISEFILLPSTEALSLPENAGSLISYFSKLENSSWTNEALHKIRNKIPFSEQEFFLPLFWPESSSALDYFQPDQTLAISFDENPIRNFWETKLKKLTDDYNFQFSKEEKYLPPDKLFNLFPDDLNPYFKSTVDISPVLVHDLKTFSENKIKHYEYSVTDIKKTIQSKKQLKSSWSNFTKEIKSLFSTWLEAGNTLYICCSSNNALKRAQSFINGLYAEEKSSDFFQNKIHILEKTIPTSLKFTDDKAVLIRFEDLYGKEQTTSQNTPSKHQEYFEKLEALRMGELEVGNLVAHIQHGIGQFNGLTTLEIQEITSEYIEIQYRDNNKLFLPIHKINQLRKYSSGSSTRSLDKLGGQYWQRAKSRVKSKLKEIANDLVTLYAQRKLVTRKALNVQTEDYQLFQSQFPYQETEDQLSAIASIEKDLAQEYPMDRLVCGDVGFGKTEVAMRAAFIALNEGKQVAVLSPTTVLSLQHLSSFKKRFKNWPFEIKALNRFVSPADVKKTLADLKLGKVDLVVGTHRLLSNDVVFKNLGLLVIDEEQKFGVKQKEKLKKLKTNVDIVSLSATPIPRTLNMGFLGVRDLSLISTPPKNRLPIKTYVSHYGQSVITQAIENELKRGGQVYFVHNRVQSIYSLYEELGKLLPDVRIGLGHGQMNEKDLEKVMIKFFNKEIDVLLSTTIIESGMDVSSANTMIVTNAQNFGLSQLYQLRGRVGRSENRAYCYLLVPPNRDLEKDQKERLRVLQDHTALGSGLQIAHYDLELRGAGNILGEAQSGHAEEIGYDFYIELLEEAIHEAQGMETANIPDPEIYVPKAALIPSSYIPDLKTRLYYYRKFNKLKSESQLDELENELSDSFGKPPEEVLGLFFLSATKNICIDFNVIELKSSKSHLSLKFSENPKIDHDKLFKLIKVSKNKFTLTPDQRILIALPDPEWNVIYEEVKNLYSEIAKTQA